MGGKGKAVAKGARAGVDDNLGPVKPAVVRIGSDCFDVSEIGIRHFRVAGYEGDLIPRQYFDCRLTFDLDEEPFDLPVYGTVLKLEPGEGLLCYFGKLPPIYQRSLVQYVIRWRKHNGGPTGKAAVGHT